jgi:serpin B
MPSSRILLSALLALSMACRSTPAGEPPEAATDDSTGKPASPALDQETAMSTPETKNPTLAETDRETCIKGVNALAFALWEVLELPKNAAISPTSISLAMSMVLAGARGDTAEELARALGVENTDDVHRCWSATLARWQTLGLQEGLDLDIANRLFGEESLAFADEYVDLTEAMYRARLEPMSLRTDPEGSRQAINRWVEQTTRDRINDLLPPRSIHELSTLVLVNAIYLLADWKEPFDKARTADAPFHRADGTATTVPMMQRTDRLAHATVDGVQLLELPYAGEELSMILLLPASHDGLPALERRLDAPTLHTWLDRLSPTQVNLKLPRFTIEETSSELRDAFAALGVKTLFTGDSDLTGIVADEPTSISAIVHKTFIAVDEQGTEAAAATAAMAVGGAAPPQPIDVHADRPFLFLIQDRATGALVFLGRVGDP